MRRKQGITVTMMAVTVAILLIIATTITYSINSTMNFSRLSNWVNEISYVQDVVDEKITNTSTFVSGLDSITVDVSGLTTEQIAEQFDGETLTGNTIKLYVLDLGTLNITNTVYGNLDSTQDVYAVSSTTGRVYYAGGLEVDNDIYYSLTDNLKERFSITSTAQNLSTVVFVPSTVGYSSSPITVTVKVPSTFSSIEVTTSNSEITVGSQVVKDKIYEYAVNTNNIAGNYTVNVAYNNGVDTVTTKYIVNGYDVTKPVISQISSANFVYKQTETDTIDYLINVTATDESGIKYLKYSVGTIAETEAYEYFKNSGNLIVDGKINLYRDTTDYTIYAEDKAGNYSVVNVDISEAKNVVLVPETWQENVTAIVDGVPIPKGFVASQATGENTKDEGLVIYEGNVAVTDENVTTAKASRNQYVWVPVEGDDFLNKFVRKDFDTYYSYSNVLGSGIWEVELDETTNLPKSEQNSAYITITTPTGGTTNTLAEVQAMYASVKEYQGFYIARYEAGVDTLRKSNTTLTTGSKVHFKMHKIPYSQITWGGSVVDDLGGAVEVARSIYPVTDTSGTYGVVSTLAYGAQWCRIIQWWLDTQEIDSVTNIEDYGNYQPYAIARSEINDDAKYAIFSSYSIGTYQSLTSTTSKAAKESWLLTTGALEKANLKNIYDMVGNMSEWTMEGYSTTNRVFRAGNVFTSVMDGNLTTVSATGFYFEPTLTADSIGFRAALYIKM